MACHAEEGGLDDGMLYVSGGLIVDSCPWLLNCYRSASHIVHVDLNTQRWAASV